jgi:hypothetical protein
MDLEPLSRQLGYQFFPDGGAISEELVFYCFCFNVVFSNDFLQTVFPCDFGATDSFRAIDFEIGE